MGLLRERINQAIDAWPEWDCKLSSRPKIVRRLGGGYTNVSFLLTDNNHFKVVLRLNTLFSSKLGIHRAREYHILKALEKPPADNDHNDEQSYSIVPHIHYWSESMGFAVFEYIEGRVWTLADFSSLDQRRRLFKIIERYQNEYRCNTMALANVQACEALGVADNTEMLFCYSAQLAKYWRHLCARKPHFARQHRIRYEAFYRRLRIFESLQHRYALVHHDLVPANIIEGVQGLRIIDWEYAGVGWKGLDQAFINSQRRGVKFETMNPIYKQLLDWFEILWWEVR